MSKGGRPNAKPDEALTAHVALRLTEAERLALWEQATKAGFGSLSQYLRSTLPLAGETRPRTRPATAAAGVFTRDDRQALVNLGNNLNQALKVAHAGKDYAAVQLIVRASSKLDDLFDRYLPK